MNSRSLAIRLIDALSRTWRIKEIGARPAAPAVLAFFHGSMLPVWKRFAGTEASALVSQSRDGAILTELLERWGYRVVRGSSSKSGRDALDALTELASNSLVLITPDGPRGPAGKFKAGAVVAAQRAGVPLVLCGVEFSAAYRFSKSWDRFALPLPFSKIILRYSQPLSLAKDLTREEINQRISEAERALNELDRT